MLPTIYQVSEINRYIKGKLEGDDFLRNLGVQGEISNFKHHSSGHMYFTLKDEESTLRCVMFRSQNRNLSFTPRNGLQVIALGSIGVYARDGVYQFYVEAMEPAGVGSLHLAFEELKKKLAGEGLFAPERKKTLPLLPRRVGVITSPTGAAIRDIITVSRRRFANVDLIVAPVLVQGDRAPAQMVAALEALARVPGVDVIIIGRGGGSWEELWPFNDEKLARAIAACPVPVITAVGHETDFTIVDFVADVRAPTPSAAAELAVPDKAELHQRLQSLAARSYQGIRTIIAQERKNLSALGRRRPFTAPEIFFNEKRLLLDGYARNLERAMTQCLGQWRSRLSLQAGRLDTLSPLAVLERGYSIVFAEDGRIVKRAGEVSRGEKIRVKLARGQLGCRIEEVKEGETGV
ncbi:MAG TPA: exodeoxyribonuclease VII large subunit [Firmicutes bacterium]|nr:exodeoxyribonuclease VII large subunit [Bacillota bacterium]